jgi:hypothetical protein
MTLPASGAISMSNFNVEAGLASNNPNSMSWVYANTKAGQQSYSFSNYYSKAWYQRNVDNCNNGNCNCGNCNCYDFPQNCVNCFQTQCIAGNCDARAWFQNNCNCDNGAIFNCNYNVWQSNCNCNCACNCACCFPAYSMVRMYDGSYKRIDEIKIGDKVDGGHGLVNNVIAYHEIELGKQPIYTINGRHKTTREHRHYTTEGWAAIDTTAAAPEYVHEITIDNNGTKEKRKNIKLKYEIVKQLKVGMSLMTNNGPELIETIEENWDEDTNQLVYTLVCDGSHAHIVNGVIVSAWARDDDFDYNTWTQR